MYDTSLLELLSPIEFIADTCILYTTSAINSILVDKSISVASVTNFSGFDVGEPTRL